MNVQQFLTEKSAHFDVMPHSETYDSQRLAQTLHVPGKEIAKTVLLRADHGYRFFVAILPATKRINLMKLSHQLGDSELALANEDEIQKHCPDCDLGVLPPFGSQYGLRTVVDDSLTEDEDIIFEGNTHREAIRMRMADFQSIEQPLVCDFAE